MSTRKRYLLFILLSFIGQLGFAQLDTDILSYRDYIKSIYQYHPIAKKAYLKSDWAEATELEARGNLDPKIASDWNQKRFDDKLYYSKYQAKVKLPTAYGIDVVGGYENTEGILLNPESTTDDFGLWNVGVEVNVLQGLIVNERRTSMQQASVMQDLANNERQLILNDLIYDASIAYLVWQQYDSFDKVLEENVSLALNYVDNTKQSYRNGEKTAMDTLEAFILYQDAISEQQKNEMNLIKSRQQVENYLWYDDSAISLKPDAQPENYMNPIISSSSIMDDQDLSKHPLLLASMNKRSILEIEQRLKREKLKPKLKLKYNPLLASSSNSIAPNYSINDYKWGFDFSMPLLFRSERGALQKSKIKVQELNLDIDNKQNELQNKIENSRQQQTLLRDQLMLLSDNVNNYKRLLEGESEKFKYGESSIFLLNKRQEKYIYGRLKLIETFIKRQLELLNYRYYSNQLLTD